MKKEDERKNENKKNENMVECHYRGVVIEIPLSVFLRTAFQARIESDKYVRYKDGARMYSMSEREFYSLAHGACATRKIGKMVLVNTEVIDAYIETKKEN